MNYRQAMKRKNGRWDYTNKNSDIVIPIGFCVSWDEYTRLITRGCGIMYGGSEQGKEEARKQIAEIEPFKDKFHDNGHATEKEACECYRQYLLLTKTRYHKKPLNDAERPQHQECVECREWSQSVIEIGTGIGHRLPVCEKHCTPEIAQKYFPEVGWSVSSY